MTQVTAPKDIGSEQAIKDLNHEIDGLIKQKEEITEKLEQIRQRLHEKKMQSDPLYAAWKITWKLLKGTWINLRINSSDS